MRSQLSKNYSQQGMLIGRNSFFQERVHQLLIQYQMVIIKNMHMSNIIQTKRILFRSIYAYTYTYMQ